MFSDRYVHATDSRYNKEAAESFSFFSQACWLDFDLRTDRK